MTDSYHDALEALYSARMFGMKLGLDNIRFLLSELDHPENRFLSIHVAGTNGKGSVAALLESVLRSAGVRTGLFTSPHIASFRERIRVNGEVIDRHEVVELITAVESIAFRMEKVPGLTHPTFFELVTAMAAKHFADREVRIGIFETGLGGRLDATNALPSTVQVITGIGLEHQKYLGNTIEKIAREKAGIIKNGCPVIVSRQVPEAMAVIENASSEQAAPLLRVGKELTWDGRRLKDDLQTVNVRTPVRLYMDLESRLIGSHQADNLSVAVGALEALRSHGYDIPEPVLRQGVLNAQWPARFEIVRGDPTFILDAAANPHAASSLTATLAEWKPKEAPLLLVLGMLNDKDAGAFSRMIAPFADEIVVTRPESERAMPADELRACVADAGFTRRMTVVPQLSEALTRAAHNMRGGNGCVLVTGSLFLMARAREFLGLACIQGDFPLTDRLSGGDKQSV